MGDQMSLIDDKKEEIISSIKMLEENEIKSSLFPIKYDYLKGLNDSQKIAATRLEGNYLVIAGPGAGKTHTLLYRVVHMVKMGISAKEICIVTFTRKAANQLKYRIERILPDIELGFVGTIHSLAFTLINRSISNPPRLIDPEDDLMVLKLAIEEHSLKLPRGTKIRTVQKIIDYSAVTGKTIEESLVDLNKESLNPDDIKDILAAHNTYKSQNGYINYSDAIIMASGADRGFLKYLMIDEYQDTDPIQLTMIKKLNFPNVMAIGDDFQSIYGFRGADNKIILNFGNDFENAKVIKLNVNYRSTSEIVEAENAITNASEYGYKKSLVSHRGVSNIPVEIVDTDMFDVENILNRISEIIKEDNKKTLAVIYRYNRKKQLIEPWLIENQIDYVVYGGIKLMERKHIKDLCAILLTNLNKNDLIPYMRALMLLDGIGEVGAKRIIHGRSNSERKDLNELKRIINNEYPDVESILQDAGSFYMQLESVLIKSNYTKEEILDDFRLLNDLARNYKSVTNFVNDVILDSSVDKFSRKDKRARIILTTIHSAKGLEFNEVHFMYDPERQFSYEGAEENRRLFYTAVSRAKDRVVIYDYWRRNNLQGILQDFEVQFTDVEDILRDTDGIQKTRSDKHEDLGMDIDNRLVVKAIVEPDPKILHLIDENWSEIVNNLSNKTARDTLSRAMVSEASDESVVIVLNLLDYSEVSGFWNGVKPELEALLKIVTGVDITPISQTSSDYIMSLKKYRP